MVSQPSCLNPSQYPPNHCATSFCCGPGVLCGLKSICSPKEATCLCERCRLCCVGAPSCHRFHGRSSSSKLHDVQTTDLAAKTDCRTDLSFCEVLGCTDPSLDCLAGSLDASVEVAVSDWTLFVDNFGWACVCPLSV